MKKFMWVLMLFIFLACTPMVFAWDESGWDNQRVPYIRMTSAPGVTDDDFPVPFVWINETTDTAYLLVDNATGAAVWQEVTYGGSSPSYVTVDLTGVTDGNIPYMQAAGAGFGDSPLSTDGTNVGIGTTEPKATLSVAGSQTVKKTNVSDAAYGTSAFTI